MKDLTGPAAKTRADLGIKKPTPAEAYASALFINHGSVWDIKIHLQNSAHLYSIKQLMEEIEREIATRKRTTVICMIQAKINKMQKLIGNYKPVKQEATA